MVNDKMCCGIVKNKLMALIGKEVYKKALTQQGCQEINFTGKPMQGYVVVEQSAIDTNTQLEYWIRTAPEF